MPVYKGEPTKDGRKFYYYIHVTVNGQRTQVKSKKFKTKKEAERAEAQKLLELGESAPSGITFNQVAQVFLAEKKQRVKRMTYGQICTMLNHMLVTLGDVPITSLTLRQYQDALDQLDVYEWNGKGLSNFYKNKIIGTFKQLCEFARRRYDVTTAIPDKFDSFKNEDKKEMKFITLDEFNRFISVIENPIHIAFFTTLYFMGLRCGEANGLMWPDIDFNKKALSVKRTVNTKRALTNGYEITTPKTKSSIRTLPLPDIVYNALYDLHEHQYVEGQNQAEMFVFGGQRPFPESTLQKIKNAYFKKAELEPIRIHDFRHSCASYLINKGATPILVSKWLGHANVTLTLNTYSHLWKSELLDIVDVINKDIIST